MVTREEFVECPSCSCTDTSYEVIEEKDSAFREPVYSLGSSDPVAIVSDRTSSFKIDDNLFFAGVEYKTYVDGELLHTVQDVMFNKSFQNTTHEGMLTLLGTPGTRVNKEFLSKKGHLLIILAKDELGRIEVAFNGNINIDEFEWGVAIDDIITETKVHFSVVG